LRSEVGRLEGANRIRLSIARGTKRLTPQRAQFSHEKRKGIYKQREGGDASPEGRGRDLGEGWTPEDMLSRTPPRRNASKVPPLFGTNGFGRRLTPSFPFTETRQGFCCTASRKDRKRTIRKGEEISEIWRFRSVGG